MDKINSGGAAVVLGIAVISTSLATLYLDPSAPFWFVLVCGCGGTFLITFTISLRYFVVKGLIDMGHDSAKTKRRYRFTFGPFQL